MARKHRTRKWSEKDLLAFITEDGRVDLADVYLLSDGDADELMWGVWQASEDTVKPTLSMDEDDARNYACVEFLLRRGCVHYKSVEECMRAQHERQAKMDGKPG